MIVGVFQRFDKKQNFLCCIAQCKWFMDIKHWSLVNSSNHWIGYAGLAALIEPEALKPWAPNQWSKWNFFFIGTLLSVSTAATIGAMQSQRLFCKSYFSLCKSMLLSITFMQQYRSVIVWLIICCALRVPLEYFFVGTPFPLVPIHF